MLILGTVEERISLGVEGVTQISSRPLQPSQLSVDIVHSTDQPLGFWKLGGVKELLVGQDGEVCRGAVVCVVANLLCLPRNTLSMMYALGATL